MRRPLKDRKFPLYEILIASFGAILGVLFSQFEYFNLDDQISLGDLIIFILTSIVALYVANNISRSLSRIQTIKALYQEDVKAFINYTKQLEDWIVIGVLPSAQLRSHMKIGNMKMLSLIKIYGSTGQINATFLPGINIKYNALKTGITSLNTSNNGLSIVLSPSQISLYLTEVENIKNDLLNAIINS